MVARRYMLLVWSGLLQYRVKRREFDIIPYTQCKYLADLSYIADIDLNRSSIPV